MDDLVKKIKKAGKVVEALTQLALSIGTPCFRPLSGTFLSK